MQHIAKLLSKEERIKKISDSFGNGQFNIFDRSEPREIKKVSVFNEPNKGKQNQKGNGSCFELNLPANISAMSNDLLRSGLFSSAKRIEPSDEAFISNIPIALLRLLATVKCCCLGTYSTKLITRYMNPW